jgi:hypothetical protein
MGDPRQHVHELIDRLPPVQLSARDWLAQNGGKGIPHEEAMPRLGLR